ncbi:hypothetical protein [Spirosoma koreense]
MKLGERLLKHLNKTYAPSQMIAFRFGRYDVAMKTNEDGNPVLAFVGQADERGIIKGQQYARRLVRNAEGAIIKDHWDDRGKV